MRGMVQEFWVGAHKGHLFCSAPLSDPKMEAACAFSLSAGKKHLESLLWIDKMARATWIMRLQQLASRDHEPFAQKQLSTTLLGHWLLFPGQAVRDRRQRQALADAPPARASKMHVSSNLSLMNEVVLSTCICSWTPRQFFWRWIAESFFRTKSVMVHWPQAKQARLFMLATETRKLVRNSQTQLCLHGFPRCQ